MTDEVNEMSAGSRGSHVDLRDHFAAAALTGLLAAPTDKDRSMEYWARLAYESADAMLRQRAHEPAPTNPVLWVVEDQDGGMWTCRNKPEPLRHGLTVSPLFRQPHFSATDLAALEAAAYGSKTMRWQEIEATLRSLLARMK